MFENYKKKSIEKKQQKLEIKRQKLVDTLKIKDEKRMKKLGITPEPEPAPAKPKVALCLGGGGARGFAHIGALKAFEEAGLDFDLCVGTSVGSLVGCLYSAGLNSSEMMEYAAQIDLKDIKKGPVWSPDDSKKISKIVTDNLGMKKFSDLKKPFYAVAVDLKTGKEIILDNGDVALAVAASCTVPLVFKPLVYRNMHLVDGGLLNNIPADVCRMLGADYVITVDVNPTRGGVTQDLGMFSVIKASFNIMGANASFNGLLCSDVIISANTSDFSSAKKDGFEEMYKIGYDAAKVKVDEIIALINSGEPSKYVHTKTNTEYAPQKSFSSKIV